MRDEGSESLKPFIGVTLSLQGYPAVWDEWVSSTWSMIQHVERTEYPKVCKVKSEGNYGIITVSPSKHTQAVS